MSLYDYLKANFKDDGEPILTSELPCSSKGYLRQQLKELVDQGKLWRFMPGIYYLPYEWRGTKGPLKFNRLILKKYYRNKNEIYGYSTRFSLYNDWQFSTQVPYVPQICTNKTSCNRIIDIDDSKFFLYKPRTFITKENVNELQFLDLMENLFTMTEVRGEEMDIRLQIYLEENEIDFCRVKELICFYPAKNKIIQNMEKVGLQYLINS